MEKGSLEDVFHWTAEETKEIAKVEREIISETLLTSVKRGKKSGDNVYLIQKIIALSDDEFSIEKKIAMAFIAREYIEHFKNDPILQFMAGLIQED